CALPIFSSGGYRGRDADAFRCSSTPRAKSSGWRGCRRIGREAVGCRTIPSSSGCCMLDSAQVLARTGGRELRRVVYDEDEIRRRVEEMGADITAHYPADEGLLLVGLLKGAFIFVGDLVRAIARPLQVDFLVASSYGSGTTSSGEVKLLYDPEADLRDRHV